MFAQLARWFRTDETYDKASTLYIALVEQARNPFFYAELNVPDSLDGRFEMVLMHMFLLMHRLKAEPEQSYEELNRQIIEIMFNDMDRSLRELGVSDTGVGKRVKKMANALYGRLHAYEQSASEDDSLREAVHRNVYGTVKDVDAAHVQAMAAYCRQALEGLHTQDADKLAEGQITWPAPASTLHQ
ncbi:MAG: hypothetical protein CMM94_02205 [Rickettsiales bacterium]|nr:hypothetical protein [Rickettsiales bacterium]